MESTQCVSRINKATELIINQQIAVPTPESWLLTVESKSDPTAFAQQMSYENNPGFPWLRNQSELKMKTEFFFLLVEINRKKDTYVEMFLLLTAEV